MPSRIILVKETDRQVEPESPLGWVGGGQTEPKKLIQSESTREDFSEKVAAKLSEGQAFGREGGKDMVGRKERGKTVQEVGTSYAVAKRQERHDPFGEPKGVQNG